MLLSRSHTPEDQDGGGDGCDDHDEDDCDDGHGNCKNDDEDAHLEILGFEIVTSSCFSARPEVLASINCNWLCFVVFSYTWFYLVVSGLFGYFDVIVTLPLFSLYSCHFM